MLHPLQLKEVSQRYAVEIAELRDYFGKTGTLVETREAMGSVAMKLQQDGAFRRGLALHMWAIFHAPGGQVGYPDAMAMLAVAAAGPYFAAESSEADTHELLRFVMDARSSTATPISAAPAVVSASPAVASIAPAVYNEVPASVPLPPVAAQPPIHFVDIGPESNFQPVALSEDEGLPTFVMEEEDENRRPLLWGGIAACALLVLGFGFWMYHQSSAVSNAVATAPAIVANGETESSEPAEPLIAAVAFPPTTRSTHASAPSHRPHPAPVATRPVETVRATAAPVVPAPRNVAPRNTPAPAFVASTVPAAVSPAPAKPSANVPAIPARTLAKVDVHPVTTPQPATKTSRGPAPIFHGSDAPIAVLNTPVVRSATLGNMASHFTSGSAPQYPAAAVDQHVQGEVRLEAEVDRAGNVISTRVVSGPALLQEAASNALQSWQYRPYMYEGKPIAVNATVVMDFQLQ
jgi:TonB family protein